MCATQRRVCSRGRLVAAPRPRLPVMEPLGAKLSDMGTRRLAAPLLQPHRYAPSPPPRPQLESVTQLLKSGQARAAALRAREAPLLARCADAAGGASGRAAALRELDGLARAAAVGDATALLALCGSLLTVEQAAAFAVASWPHAPSVGTLIAAWLPPPVAAGAAAGGRPASP